MASPLLILHLSDLHFGPHGRFAGQDMQKLGQRFHQAVEQARSDLGFEEKVGLVIVTGDIAEAARPKEYQDATTFFEALVGAMGLARRYVVFVPGNHDVSWVDTKKVGLDQEDEAFDDAERDRRIQAVKLRKFEGFVEAFHGKDPNRLTLPLVPGAHLASFEDLRVSVAALSSCERESHLQQGGFLSEAQAEALMRRWREPQLSRWLKIVAIHHNPVATVPAGVRSWVDYLKTKREALKGEVLDHFVADVTGFEQWQRLQAVAQDCHVQLVLHGHHHAHDSAVWPWRRGRMGQTLILSAGSWGLKPDQLPEGQPAMMHLLRLDPSKGEALSVLRVYEPRARLDGVVEPGTFAVDAANPKPMPMMLARPEGWDEGGAAPKKHSQANTRPFLEAYQRRFVSRYLRLDLAGVGETQPGGARAPVTATLDTMYLPLRLGKNKDPRKLDDGQVLDIEALLARQKPLVICGPAGSGKTTWMRFSFRRLMEMVETEKAVPFLIELRDLSRHWQEVGAEERTIEKYLCAKLAELGTVDVRASLEELFAAPHGPRPVLLVDGWDELGDLGARFREQLVGLCTAFPRLLVVVTSRPYGESRPSTAEEFEEVDIQPLSDAEIELLAERFFRYVYGEDGDGVGASKGRFLHALRASEDAQALARTALLLTMMLLISRSQPLPDKRHELYHACLKNLLSARPDWRAEEGARLSRDQWCPSDGAERMRVVATLAFRVQSEGYEEDGRAPIVRRGKELLALLPSAWTEDQRQRFLAWLVGGAGVMVDRTDDTYQFTHMSFQEYLTAHYMAANTKDSEERLAVCRDRMHNADWWETLRLWAAIVHDGNPDFLVAVLEELLKGDPSAFWLAGAMLADGVGEAVFGDFIEGLKQRFHLNEWPHAEMAAGAWAASRQEARRSTIGQRWSEVIGALRWAPAAIAAEWKSSAAIEARDAEDAFERMLRAPRTGSDLARGRALSGATPAWPPVAEDVVLLRLWPGQRIQAGMRLQNLITLGGEVALRQIGPHVLKGFFEDERARNLARYLARYLARHVAPDVARDVARYFARYFAQGDAPRVARDVARFVAGRFARDVARHVARDVAPDSTRYIGPAVVWPVSLDAALDLALDVAGAFAQDIAQDVVQYRHLARHVARDVAPDWGLPGEPWALDFAAIEIASIGRASSRWAFADAQWLPSSLLQRFQPICRASYQPAPPDPALFSFPPNTDPLWPALARHITRQSTPEDRALLEDLARHPEKREPPLSWGLKYYVRGDLVLDDGSELTLDALCDELGLPHLPYLEDMPDELDVPWDDGSPE